MSLSGTPLPRRPIKRALLSVFDKTGLVELGSTLREAGVELFSTGSTAGQLRAAGLDVTDVADLTGFPECLGGRVKTLHPAVHAGILADQGDQEHMAELAALDLEPFDLVAVNLYPFQDTLRSGGSPAEVLEMIDIGGPAMIRAAAKNHQSVAVLTNPRQYGELEEALLAGGTTPAQRIRLAAAAFQHTASYDAAVATWFTGLTQDPGGMPAWLGAAYRLERPLRYGENPHQGAGLYLTEPAAPAGASLATATQLSGKEMSYNNYQDTDAALRAAYDQQAPTAAIIKHANPCGIASDERVAGAYEKAFACDPVSAFGSVVAVNRRVDKDLAALVAEVFTEVVAAPGFTDEALDILRRKKNLRLLQVDRPEPPSIELVHIGGGLLAQEPDDLAAAGVSKDGTPFGDAFASWRLVAGEPATKSQAEDLVFAWRAVRSVKSNAILIAKDQATVGIGMGQVNRVDAAGLAVTRANTLAGTPRTSGAVAASDAFFPFPDGLEVLLEAGVKAVVAPGGSVRDEEVIQAANEAGATLYFTGVRHFWH